MDTFFYKDIEKFKDNPNEQGMQNRVRKWVKKTDIFKYQHVVIPVLENCHWILAIISWPVLYVLDSLNTNEPKRIAAIIRHFVQYEAQQKYPEENRVYNENTMPVIYPNCPKQQDNINCGVFILKFAENFAQKIASNNNFQPHDAFFDSEASKITRPFLLKMIRIWWLQEKQGQVKSKETTTEDKQKLESEIQNLKKVHRNGTVKKRRVEVNGKFFQIEVKKNGKARFRLL